MAKLSDNFDIDCEHIRDHSKVDLVYTKTGDLMQLVTVRWHDGFKKSYEVMDYQFGSDYLWVKLATGAEKWIPTRSVRWISPGDVI